MKKLFLIAGMLLLLACAASAETLYAGQEGSGRASVTDALQAARDGDVILLAGGTYTEATEAFPWMIDKAVAIRPEAGALPVVKTPAQTTAAKITARGASVEGVRFDHIRCAIWVLTDDVTVKDCEINLTDEKWRVSSCGLWVAGAKRLTLTGNAFSGCGIALAGPPISERSAGLPVLTAMFEVGEDIEFFTTHTVMDNTVNDKPLLYLVGEHDRAFEGEAGQIVAAQCENLTFSGTNVAFASIGVQLAYCKNIEVYDSEASDNGIFGIYVMKSEDCVIARCTANRCAHGIDIRAAARVTVDHCVTNESGQGTFLSFGRNCLVRDCEIVGNGTGFFSASGGDNHVDACRIEGNELGLYVQHEALFTLTDSQIAGNTPCGLRATGCGVVCAGNQFANNFTGCLALDCAPLTCLRNAFSGSEDCDLYARNGKSVKLIGNAWSDAPETSCRFDGAELPLITE